MDPEIRPLWMGMRFFGPAVTMRVVPTNRRMPVVSRADALKQHDIWGEMGGWHADVEPHVKPGCVIVTSTGGARECGYWGSNNSLDMMSRGVAGIVTEGNCRDTDEVIMQKCNVACRGHRAHDHSRAASNWSTSRSRSAAAASWSAPATSSAATGTGASWCPIEVAEDVLAIAARIAVDDKKARRRLYDKLGRKPDETVDWEAAAAWFKDLL